MLKNYELNEADEEIVNELDNLYGVEQNKETLKDLISYVKLKQNNAIDFGNYNIIIRNDSAYNLLDDLIKVCVKIYKKYGVIHNDKIFYLDGQLLYDDPKTYAKKISETEEEVIVVNDEKSKTFSEDLLGYVVQHQDELQNKVLIFVDQNRCIGITDVELGDLVSWRMTIEKISLSDKLKYCKNKLDEQEINYKEESLKNFADVPFWLLKNMMMKLIVECKAKNITTISDEMLEKRKEKNNNYNREEEITQNNNNEDFKEELNNLVGLENVKLQVNKILNYIKLNKKRGRNPSLHMCFTGNPGTGKTSVARAVGNIFAQEKILSDGGKFVEIHGRDLVDKYVGWTAQKVKKIIKSAMGGVLFIDEAYSLISDRVGGFENEAIATLIKEMEDHRDEICIILAGYTDEMKQLINQNPGFESRIQFTINFPNYNENELLEIFMKLCKEKNYKLSSACKKMLSEHFSEVSNERNFSNGRYVRNLFEKVEFEQADRVVKNECREINSINKIDIENAIQQSCIENKREKIKIGFCSIA